MLMSCFEPRNGVLIAGSLASSATSMRDCAYAVNIDAVGRGGGPLFAVPINLGTSFPVFSPKRAGKMGKLLAAGRGGRCRLARRR